MLVGVDFRVCYCLLVETNLFLTASVPLAMHWTDIGYSPNTRHENCTVSEMIYFKFR